MGEVVAARPRICPKTLMRDVFFIFLRLGFTSFGGPMAHFGYFRRDLVLRRAWLSDAEYADLIALCQMLPGPASSQVGFALGHHRAGWPGAIAAFVGFTLPSFLLMLAAATALRRFLTGGLAHGLHLAAVAVVAVAVAGMARRLCATWATRGIALVAGLVAFALSGFTGQLAAIAIGGGIGLAASLAPPGPVTPIAQAKASPAWLPLLLYLVLMGLALSLRGSGPAAQLAGFVRSGGLVFGGGHVVLALLQRAVVAPGFVPESRFLAGYGVAQALPGPLFSLAAYLGALLPPPLSGVAGALLATLAIFLPGFLLLAALLPVWARLRQADTPRSMLTGLNAAVVGLLAASWLNPILGHAVHTGSDVIVSALLCLALARFSVPAIAVVAAGVAAGLAGF